MKLGIGVRLLGPVEARTTDGWITAPPQQRSLLALLALRMGQAAPVEDIIDGIWPEAPPASARASIQVMVTRVRHILADLPGGDIERCGDAYRLAIAPESIDLHQFRSLVQAGRDAPDALAAVAAFDRALALWRGPALADVPGTGTIEAIRFALAEERLSARQDRISALLAAGLDRQAAEELTGLMVAHPLAERLAALLMIALYRCGRQADALQVFRDLRRRLSNELAIEPGHELQGLHQQILTGDLAPSVMVGWKAMDFGISESCQHRWLKTADTDDGFRPGMTTSESGELRALRSRNKVLQTENEILRRAAAYVARDIAQDDIPAGL